MITPKEYKEEIISLLSQDVSSMKNKNYLQMFLNQEKKKGTFLDGFDDSRISRIMNASITESENFYDHFKINNNRKKVLELLDELLKNVKTDDFIPALVKILEPSNDYFTMILLKILNERIDLLELAQVLQWLFIASLMRDRIEWLKYYYSNDFIRYMNGNNVMPIQRHSVNDYLINNKIIRSLERKRLCAELPVDYYELRKILIDNAKGTLYIAGETLEDAFSVTFEKSRMSIISNIVDVVRKGAVNEIKIYLMDPSVFKGTETQPPESVRMTVNNIINQLALSLSDTEVQIRIYFLPFLDIDHAVVTDRYLLYRTTKLWTNQRDYKGSIMLFGKDEYNIDEKNPGEYLVHKKYLDTLSENSIHINTSRELPLDDSSLSEDKKIHREMRNWAFEIQDENITVELYKLYNSQLTRYAISSFMLKRPRFKFHFKNWFQNLMIDENKDSVNSAWDTVLSDEDGWSRREKLFCEQNLLGDQSQKVLLKRIRKTEELLNEVVKHYDHREESGAVVIPALDLGYPNNVVRLAGGFATGMFVDWECGTPIIPIDATVNVCSSSVFRINPEKKEYENFEKYIKEICNEAVDKYGYSFSFLSGNHFLMLATDENGEYYLVLHSSAKEMKESYLGLYPKEINWYYGKVKSLVADPFHSGEPYLRYIKGEEAEYFIKTAHHLEKYNEEIHKWISWRLNQQQRIKDGDISIIKHHYYMPTDSSIAIGTYVEAPGQTVPLFSNVGKPVYLFQIAKDNWTYELRGKKKPVCIVPHGWGQQIENISEIKNLKDATVELKCIDGKSVKYKIVSTARIDDQVHKQIRDFEDGQTFLEKGKNYLKGTITKTLTPKYLYCQQHCGRVKHIYFLRHAKTKYNEAGKITGRNDIDIIPNQSLTSDIYFEGKIYCSTALRCKSTIKLLKHYDNQEIVYTENLQERSLGCLEGLIKEVAIKKYPDCFVRGKVSVDAKINGGETIEEVKRRLLPIYELITNDEIEDDILICSHNQTLKVLYAMLKNIEITDEYWRSRDFPNSEIKMVHFALIKSANVAEDGMGGGFHNERKVRDHVYAGKAN